MVVEIAIGVVVLLVLSGFRITQEYERGVVFRLGRYRTVKGPGLYWIIPFREWQPRVDLRRSKSTAAVKAIE